MVKEVIELNGVTYRSVDSDDGFCFGCVFYEDPESSSCNDANDAQPCTAQNRSDRRQIIWVVAEAQA